MFFVGLLSVLAGLALGVVCGFNDKSLIDGKLSRAASLSDMLTIFVFCWCAYVVWDFFDLLIRIFNVVFRYIHRNYNLYGIGIIFPDSSKIKTKVEIIFNKSFSRSQPVCSRFYPVFYTNK